jgi:hypothetical protein
MHLGFYGKHIFQAFQGGNAQILSIMFGLLFLKIQGEHQIISLPNYFQVTRKKSLHYRRPYEYSEFVAQLERNSFNLGHKIIG